MTHERFKHQVRAARNLALDAPISDYDARGLVYLLSELLKSGASFSDLVMALCGATLAGSRSTYCRDWSESDHKKQAA